MAQATRPGEALALDGSFLQGFILGRRKRALAKALILKGYLLLTSPEQYRLALQMIEARLRERGVDPKPFLNEARTVLDNTILIYPPSEKALREARVRGFKPGKDAELAALALKLGIPVVTSDRDFWGRGIATWLPEHLAVYLNVR